MRVLVRFFAMYREIVGSPSVEVEIPEGSTPEDLWHKLCAEYPRLPQGRPWVAVAVNRKYIPGQSRLNEGDEVVFMPPVSGGSDMIGITDEGLACDDMLESVIDDATGAVVVFVGTVRGFSGDKAVAALEYEAYREMAEPKMAEIAGEIHSKWNVRSVAMKHKTGRMQVGEVSVIIAVSASHRKEAFEACQYAIDRLKEIVPIWKKEIGPGGEEWL